MKLTLILCIVFASVAFFLLVMNALLNCYCYRFNFYYNNGYIENQREEDHPNSHTIETQKPTIFALSRLLAFEPWILAFTISAILIGGIHDDPECPKCLCLSPL